MTYVVYFYPSDDAYEWALLAGALDQLPGRRADVHAHTLADAMLVVSLQDRPATVHEGDALVASWAPDECARYYNGRAP